jgi:predicted restriction endonuclease
MLRKAKKKIRRKPDLSRPNSVTWRNKADTLWADLVKMRDGYRCAICGKKGASKIDGTPSKGLHAHHIISRARLRYRYEIQNGICLCRSHHGAHPNFRNRTVSAHGDYDVFMDWIEENRPCQYQWYLEHRDDKRMPCASYEDSFVCLMKLKEKYEAKGVSK